MARERTYTDQDYGTIGRRHSSEDVAAEVGKIVGKWTRDLSVMGEYGHGRSGLDEFEALRAEHTALRTRRPEAVASKTSGVRDRDTGVAAAWTWIDKVGSVLRNLARENAELATKLEKARPSDDSGLEPGIGALAKLLDENKAALPGDANVVARLAEAPEIRGKLAAAPGIVATAKSAPIVDTFELDVLDGKLYVRVVDYYSASRKAVRNGELKTPLSDFKMTVLNQTGQPKKTEPLAAPPVRPTPADPVPPTPASE